MVIKLKWIVAVVVLTVLVACGNESTSDQEAEGDQGNEAALLPLEVEILTASDAFKPGEPGEIEVLVTQGGEQVNDADEVVFEIWKQGHEDESENFDAEHAGEGRYTLTHTFDEDGIYEVIAHVTARDMHTMPKKEFIVGDVEAGDESGHGHGEHGDALVIHLMEPETLAAGEGAEWAVHLEKDGAPLSEAEVKVEFWKTGEEKHEFVDMTEGQNGKYTAELAFAEPGEYQLTVHVEKGELHEHKEEVVNVP
ncbi:FixH family protein [Novibacillus thermophilus]|jgi:nitrogen fixation protein FixH|uniref:YtkA-like domain-containing protein n=1 Tax=Novibacillus thermophilus TaxID=1471761 RepID=A0A1U9K402_9BACL|nr:FixH family protein [Novibacillus thermophilus]AQS54771.1 hypothetical protein B0W44_02290 [Novibacillus thermophilus]